MDKEKPSGRIVDLKMIRKLFEFVGPYKRQFYILTVLTFVGALTAPVMPYLVKETVDRFIAAGNMRGVTVMVTIMLGVLIFRAIIQYFNTFISGWLGQHIVHALRVKLYKHVLSLKLKFYDRTPVGRLVTRNISDIETLAEVFSQGMAAMLGDILQLVFILTVMFYINWRLTLISLAMLPLLLISTYVFKEKIKKSFNSVRTAVSNLNSFVQERITGMNIVQAFNSEEREFKKFSEINREHRRAHIKSVLYYSVYFPVAEVIGAMGLGLLIWYGGMGMAEETITKGDVIAFTMFISMFFRPIRMIADRFNTLQMGIVSTDRIIKLLESKEHIPNDGKLTAKNLEGNVRFENVWFAYNEEDYILKNINFDVHSGQTIALVGATGAGKSSVINLLSRFYEINKGKILIDEKNINEYEIKTLRERVSVVLQDVFLFSGSVTENITLGNKNITSDQVRNAAKAVGALEFIEKLPGGFDYNVMERGATLSVGQRQLISFVRAMVYDPKVIILDEATSSVDSETEELIQQAIDNLMKGRTAIVIAHRLSTIQKADKILVLDKGEIKEEGTHEELIKKEGLYANLHAMQYVV